MDKRMSDLANNIFVVLGVPRGGTSVVSRGLKALGVPLGEKLTPANEEWNPKGFWEDNEIVYKVNARILATLNKSWESLDRLHAMTEALTPLKKMAISLLQQRFATTSLWGFKDPNTAKLLPFWQTVFHELQINEHYVIVLRNPLSSAQSYHQLTGIDISHCLLLWLTHMMAAIETTHGKNRVIVSYDLLMKNPRLQLERIKKTFSVPLPAHEADINDYVTHFVDNKLHHYRDGHDDLLVHPALAVSPLCLKLYDHLYRIANDEILFTDSNVASAWVSIQHDYKKMLPIYSYIDSLLTRNQTLEKSLETLHKSRLWKMIYPLRMIDNALRSRRKRLKQKKLVYER
jgi:hypothetical protein